MSVHDNLCAESPFVWRQGNNKKNQSVFKLEIKIRKKIFSMIKSSLSLMI